MKFKSFMEYGMPPRAAAYKDRMDKKFGKYDTVPKPGTKDYKTVVNKMRTAAGLKTKRKFKYTEGDAQSADKKVQDYIDQDGKKKTRMVPVDKQIVDKDKELDK